MEPVTDPTASDGLDDLAAELDETFRGELAQRLAQMREALSGIEIDRDRGRGAEGAVADTLDELTRHAHSIKGGAMLVGRREIAQLAGALEAYFPAHAAANAPGWRTTEVRAATELMARLGATERAGATPGDPSIAAEVQRLVNALAESDARR
jgi:chemotaxis protein histidine kinase CheA